MLKKKSSPETALNLGLSGAHGSFAVDTGPNALEVEYLLTTVSLDFEQASNEPLLRYIAPVREVFNVNQLGFSELMQRDVDDYRVTSELVPYLLGEGPSVPVKLFPPIVVMLLPLEVQTLGPAPLYPKTYSEEIPETNEAYGTKIQRAGTIGKEVYQLERTVAAGEILTVPTRLRINTNSSRLVIVDGQHRAMALLALYRNLRDDWNDVNKAPYKDYYASWTPEYLENFNLEKISLPLMVCTIPALDQDYAGDFDLIRACRTVFLTLNKTARMVSSSRNVLLDDTDIVATFLRSVLAQVKNRTQVKQGGLRLFDVELEQGDRQKLQQATAITGVNHIYYMIEDRVLDRGEPIGINARTGYFRSRTDIGYFLTQVAAGSVLTQHEIDTVRRDFFGSAEADRLTNLFMQQYGSVLLRLFDELEVYRLWTDTTAELKGDLESKDVEVLNILYGSENSVGSLRKYTSWLDDRMLEVNSDETTLLADRLAKLEQRTERSVEALNEKVATEFIRRASKAKGAAHLTGSVRRLYSNVFTTVAFQAALLSTFTSEAASVSAGPASTEWLDEYISQLSEFFAPRSKKALEDLLGTFEGNLETGGEKWRVVPTPSRFGRIVNRGEMKPDYWPRYRYLLLEIWKPELSKGLKTAVQESRDAGRRKVMEQLYAHKRREHARSEGRAEDSLTTAELNAILDETVSDYRDFLKRLCRPPSAASLKTLAEEPPTADLEG